MSLAFPNTVLNTIVAEAIDDLADALEGASGADIAEKVTAVVGEAYANNKQVCFGGDNYSDEWHAEAEQRGLKNLRTTPDALPEVLADATVAAFGKYEVLSERELESRYEVWVEQYVIRANIEAETTAAIARTLLLPAVLRHLALIDAAEVPGLADEVRPLAEALADSIRELEAANGYPEGVEGLELAVYARDSQLAAMAKVREVADRLEKLVADDLWPLPKYSEILFVR
jgi:glutamine synthetase